MWRRAHKATKSFYGAQRCRPSALASIALIVVTFLLVFYRIKSKPSSPFGVSKLKWNSFRASVEFRPSVELMNGTDVIWQIPESPKAVLFIAHGCGGRAANFWDRSPGCLNCVGLPEERLIVLHALDQNFAVLTISSHGKCWSLGKERGTIKWIIEWWLEKHKLEKLPVVALGASSGGYFVSALAAEMRFSSIALMIAEGVFDAIDIPKSYPPTLFLHMPKDRTRMKLVGMNMEALSQKGVHVKEVKCTEFPLTPDLLSNRIPGLDQTLSIKLFELFREKGFIDGNGYMKNDGRATRWEQALRERNISLNEWVDHIKEELNLAFGYHEMTSLQSDEIFDWFESYMS